MRIEIPAEQAIIKAEGTKKLLVDLKGIDIEVLLAKFEPEILLESLGLDEIKRYLEKQGFDMVEAYRDSEESEELDGEEGKLF